MKSTDIGSGKLFNQGGQEFKMQWVLTPFGTIKVPGFVRVPKMSASRRTWDVWKKRFVDFPKQLENEKHNKAVEMRLKQRKK